jgi:hypothetical protein
VMEVPVQRPSGPLVMGMDEGGASVVPARGSPW